MRRTAVVLGCLTALGSWMGPAEAAPKPSYFVRKVTAQGGHEIQGVPGGVLFERPGRCPASPPPAVKPLAASLGGEVSLAVEVAACPAGAALPAVRCQAASGRMEAGSKAWQGWKGTLGLTLPLQTGVHDLKLRCVIAEQPGALDGTLYLTYAPPRAPVRPVREDWLRRACEWAAGLKAGSSESQVLERILHGLYALGQRRWRYGYCSVEGSQCVFGPTSIPLPSPSLFLPPDTDLGVCKWPFVLAGTDCNFTDCFGYSSMFQYVAGTMGIGGLQELMVEGSKENGFSSHGWLRAIDPGALGNFECGYRGLPCSFLFNVHDLRERDGAIYDSTFGQTYNDLSELVASNILQQLPGLVVLQDGQACRVIGAPYGGFSPFREMPKGAVGCQRLGNGKAAFAETGRGPAVELESTAGDARPELLKVQLQVEIRTEGSYSVYGLLFGGPGGETLVADQPSSLVRGVAPSAHISGPPGKYPVTLAFSGEDVAAAGVPGPYWLRAVIVGAGGISEELRKRLPELSFAELGERDAKLGQVSGQWARTPRGSPVLKVSVPAWVRTPGPYAVDARLFSGGTTIAYSGYQLDLTAGAHTLTVEFAGEAIARRQIEGTSSVTVELHALDPAAGAPQGLVDAATGNM